MSSLVKFVHWETGSSTAILFHQNPLVFLVLVLVSPCGMKWGDCWWSSWWWLVLMVMAMAVVVLMCTRDTGKEPSTMANDHCDDDLRCCCCWMMVMVLVLMGTVGQYALSKYKTRKQERERNPNIQIRATQVYAQKALSFRRDKTQKKDHQSIQRSIQGNAHSKRIDFEIS